MTIAVLLALAMLLCVIAIALPALILERILGALISFLQKED